MRSLLLLLLVAALGTVQFFNARTDAKSLRATAAVADAKQDVHTAIDDALGTLQDPDYQQFLEFYAPLSRAAFRSPPPVASNFRLPVLPNGSSSGLSFRDVGSREAGVKLPDRVFRFQKVGSSARKSRPNPSR